MLINDKNKLKDVKYFLQQNYQLTKNLGDNQISKG